MRSRIVPLLCLLCLALSSCHRKKDHTSPPAPSGPSLLLSRDGLDLAGTVKGTRFDLKGRDCESIRFQLLHIVDGQERIVTDHHLLNLPQTMEGSLYFVEEDGEPFGRKGVVSYSLSHSLKGAGSATSTFARLLLEGPYTATSEGLILPESCPRSQDTILLTRWMSKTQGDHRFSTGTLEELKKRSAETKDDVLVVMIRWEPR